MDEYEAFLRRERIREGIKACIKGTGNLDDVKKRIEINKKESRSNAIRITIKDFCIENKKIICMERLNFCLSRVCSALKQIWARRKRHLRAMKVC